MNMLRSPYFWQGVRSGYLHGTVAGLFLSGGLLLGLWLAPDHRPAVNEQGWADVCAAVGPDVPRPLQWRFTRGGVTVASGVCP